MKAKMYRILTVAIERGIDFGYDRAFKHIDEPAEQTIKDSIEREIWNNIDEVFNFEDEI